jgi:hypothetical protein
MGEMISYCGLICSTCPIYVATKTADVEEQTRIRTGVAKTLEQAYGIYFEASDIADCDGCRTPGGRLFSACNDCRIRNCAKQKIVENCAHCTDYICKELETFFQKDASAKERLDTLRDDMFRSRRKKRDHKYR